MWVCCEKSISVKCRVQSHTLPWRLRLAWPPSCVLRLSVRDSYRITRVGDARMGTCPWPRRASRAEESSAELVEVVRFHRCSDW